MEGETRQHPQRGNYVVYERIAPPSTVRRVRFENGTVDYLTGTEIDAHPVILDSFHDAVFPFPGPSVRPFKDYVHNPPERYHGNL